MGGDDLHRIVTLHRSMDIADKLPIALRHQEVGREAIQDSNICLAAHGVEVAIGNVFLLPLSF